jgi:hypothetical protein
VLALAPASSALAQQLGPASAASLRTVGKARTTHGPMNPGRGATVLARMLRGEGDRPTRIACRMTSPDTATCTIADRRAGADWTGTGKVWQGRHAFRARYEISTAS